MTDRKPISKKIRFEVFKRDSFKCQYCGKNAPDVVLEVDHITPVSKGGGNSLINLLTSCFDCNRGKGKREINDRDVIKKQYKEANLIAEKSLQIKEMAQWYREIIDAESEAVDILIKHFLSNICLDRYQIDEDGRQKFKQYYRRFGFRAVLNGINLSVERYFLKPKYKSEYNADKAMRMIGGICYNVEQKELKNG